MLGECNGSSVSATGSPAKVAPSASKNRKHAFIFIQGRTPLEMIRHKKYSSALIWLRTKGGSKDAGNDLSQEIIGGALRALLNLNRTTLAVVYH